MKQVIGVYGTLIVLLLNLFICITVVNASGKVAEAKEYKAAVIAEVENSNFNTNVINGCIAQANAAGYELEIINCIYDANHDIKTAEIVLTYKYEMPLLGISETKTTRGVAR